MARREHDGSASAVLVDQSGRTVGARAGEGLRRAEGTARTGTCRVPVRPGPIPGGTRGTGPARLGHETGTDRAAGAGTRGAGHRRGAPGNSAALRGRRRGPRGVRPAAGDPAPDDAQRPDPQPSGGTERNQHRRPRAREGRGQRHGGVEQQPRGQNQQDPGGLPGGVPMTGHARFLSASEPVGGPAGVGGASTTPLLGAGASLTLVRAMPRDCQRRGTFPLTRVGVANGRFRPRVKGTGTRSPTPRRCRHGEPGRRPPAVAAIGARAGMAPRGPRWAATASPRDGPRRPAVRPAGTPS
ncbi:hypothetical protein SAMN02745673_01615 [Marinactinospora thermotolerans DSM 45154]|uniref:Uncharacterized protein n=1 Tax=Marinactinospora thermotolerans DSM 45154 TaxID=1122192 RepID=A0A1T4P3I3_9ACTN|nr:hypothetical protein SAMN02745673_01615 [Marinactinospora thermotolerans DSM 45154]